MDQKAVSSRILLWPLGLFRNTVKFFIQRRNFTSFCSFFSFSNSSNLFNINFIDPLRLGNCFSSLIWLLLESADLWISFTSFSKFPKQFNKIFTQSSDLKLSSKISPGLSGVSKSGTSGLSSLCLLASSSVFEYFLTSISYSSFYLNTNF